MKHFAKGATSMRRAIATLVCGCGLAGLLAPASAWAQNGNGSIVGWGSQVVGADLSADFVAVAAGASHSLGLKGDGSIRVWGSNSSGQGDVPGSKADFVAVAGGRGHSLGLKADGLIAAWGQNDDGQRDVPGPNTD
ncbi:MAG TPA: hypothetical protein ENH80_12085, partial [Phycisphaerae bacterium]|nr:hypothetical protein [Phycisphaerae bacterium]